jgi:hypothetical protein
MKKKPTLSFHVVRRGQYRGKSCKSFTLFHTMKKNQNWSRFSKRQVLATGAVVLFGSFSSQRKELSSRQKAIIWGNILGDGHFQLSPNKKTTRLRFYHSAKQKEYVKWQFDQLDWLCETVSPPKVISEREFFKCRAYTHYREELTPFHKLTYQPTKLPNRRFVKIIPETIQDHLTDQEALMIWYLDDGTLRLDGGACRLATQCFTLAEHELLQDCLKQNFGLTSVIEKWPKGPSGVYIPSLSGHAADFLNLFSETVVKEIPSMAYKVNRQRLSKLTRPRND